MARSNVNRTAVAGTAVTATTATMLTFTLKLVNAYDRAEGEGEQPAELENTNSHPHTLPHTHVLLRLVYTCLLCVAFGIFIRFSSISSAPEFG